MIKNVKRAEKRSCLLKKTLTASKMLIVNLKKTLVVSKVNC
jgi:hypothetical protein